jgi:signal transduction histidine kinase/ligand-binding sensor domain-containing protein/CheY-like chemotaxis protein
MKYGFHIKFFLLFFLQGYLIVFSQNLRFYNYTIENGLSQNTIQAIAQDSTGFMWFGTQDGLNRFDGYHFKIYRSGNLISNRISDNFITSLLWDDKHGLWIGTNSGGIALLDMTTNRFKIFQPHDHQDSLHTNNILTIAKDRNGYILFGTPRGISIYFPEKNIFRNFDLCDGKNPVYVQSLFFDSSNRLWFGTMNNGFGEIVSYSPDTIIYAYSKDPNSPANIKSIHEFRPGILFIGSNDRGLLFYDTRMQKIIDQDWTQQISNQIGTAYINCVLVDSKNRIWIGTDNRGLFLLNKKTRKIRRFFPQHLHEHELNSNQIITIFEDRSGLIWIGTRDKGIMKMDPGRSGFEWYTFRGPGNKTPTSNIIRAIYSDRPDRVWIGTFGGGLILFNKATRSYHRFSASRFSGSLNNNSVSAITVDGESTLWVGTWGGGINLFNIRNGKVFKKYQHNSNQVLSLSNDFIQCIYKDRQNRIWVGTEHGLNLYDKSLHGFHRYLTDGNNKNSLSDNRIQSNCIKEDQFGCLWVGTWNGLNRFRLDETYKIQEMFQYFHQPGKKNSLSGNRIISLWIDDSRKDTSLVWVGTYGNGITLIVRIKDKERNAITEQFYFLDHEKGLSNDIIYTLIEDKKHAIWCSTNNGLNKIQLNSDFTFKVDVFTASNGLQSNQFFWGAAERTSDGFLIFGGINGINLFLPDRIQMNTYVPPLAFTRIGIYRDQFQILPPVTELHIFTDDIFVNIQFSALDFTASNENQYAYMVEGYHDQWIQIGSNHEVTLTGLPPGQYTFRIKGSNNNHVWNEKGNSIKLIIHPAWWQTSYFYISTILVLLIIIIATVKIRTRKIRKRNIVLQEFNKKLNQQIREKEELQKQIIQMQKLESIGILAGGIAHDFNNILTVIKGHSELGMMRNNLKKVKTDLEIILKNADRAANLIRQLLTFSKRESIQPVILDLNDTILSLMTMLERVIGEDIEIITQLTENLPEIYADRGQIEQILMNLIINARDAIHVNTNASEQKITISTAYEKISKNKKHKYPGLAGQEVVVLKVSDTGHGIPEEYLDKIFDPFFTTKSPDKGTGLGLATVYGIIRQNGGYIDVESRPGIGTIFTIYWPVSKVKRQEENGKSSDSASIVKGEGVILLIEDDENVLQFTTSSLKELGYVVKSYTSGSAALKDISGDHFEIDLVITDIVMPDMNGKEVAERIRAINPDVPILMVSGYADDNISQEEIRKYGYHFMRKPFTIVELSQKLHSILSS